MSSRMRSSFPRRKPARSSRAPIACATSDEQELGVGEARERHPEDAVAQRADELGRDLKREAGLPGASRPGDGQKPRAVREQRRPAHRARALSRRAGLAATGRFVASSVLSGGKSPRAELVQALGSDQVLQPVLAEIAYAAVAVEEPASRLRDDDLPTVGSRGDPRSAMHIDPDVALGRDDRLAGVDSHAYADRALARAPAAPRRPPRPRRPPSGERDEEGVALGVDLDAAVFREGVPQRAAVLVEEIRVSRPVLLEKPGRALDVREEEGDGAGRQLGPAHGAIIVTAPLEVVTTVGSSASARPCGGVSARPTSSGRDCARSTRPGPGRPSCPRSRTAPCGPPGARRG